MTYALIVILCAVIFLYNVMGTEMEANENMK